MSQLHYVTDPRTGLAYVKNPASGYGHITYRCHTCGELIPRDDEVFFVDPSPETAWASNVLPPVMSPSMTTHHDWHMAAIQEA